VVFSVLKKFLEKILDNRIGYRIGSPVKPGISLNNTLGER
jgi:hypothetical protein